MKILQWSMTVPIEKQKAFIKWFRESALSALNDFGAINHEIHQVTDKQIVGRQIIEQNRFIERIYFDDDFDISDYFTKVKGDPEAHRLSKMYEQIFGVTDIELRILEELS